MLILYLILIISCNLGLFEILGLSISFIKMGIDVLILIFFSRSYLLPVFNNDKSFLFWGWQYILFYILCVQKEIEEQQIVEIKEQIVEKQIVENEFLNEEKQSVMHVKDLLTKDSS